MTTQLEKKASMRRELYQRAILESFVKLNPRWMVRNPVMFVVEVGSVLTTLLWIQALFGRGEAPAGFIGAVTLWLWFTVLFANFAEALAEGRGKAQAEALRRTRHQTQAKRLKPSKVPSSADFKLQPANLQPGTWDLSFLGCAASWRCHPGRDRRHHPGRRRGGRRHCVGGRERDHRRERAGDP